ncbi:hypothetical protein D9M70_510250 [compost metagenome]
MPAAAGATEACGAAEQHDSGRAVAADIKIEGGAANADRAGRRDDLIGGVPGLAADPAERALRGHDRQFLHRLGIVIDELVDDHRRAPADR